MPGSSFLLVQDSSGSGPSERPRLPFEGYTGRKRFLFDECREMCIFPAIVG
jgi:hypothetical protein